jgi:hypothetical protein
MRRFWSFEQRMIIAPEQDDLAKAVSRDVKHC